MVLSRSSSFFCERVCGNNAFVRFRPIIEIAWRNSKDLKAGSGVSDRRSMCCPSSWRIVVLGYDQCVELRRQLKDWQARSAHRCPTSYASQTGEGGSIFEALRYCENSSTRCWLPCPLPAASEQELAPMPACFRIENDALDCDKVTTVPHSYEQGLMKCSVRFSA